MLLSRAALRAAVSTFAFLAAVFLLTAISFGIQRDDSTANPQHRVQDEVVLYRAENLAMPGFVVLETAGTCALTKIAIIRSGSRMELALKALFAFATLCAASYAVAFAAMMGFAADPLIDEQRLLARWIVSEVL